MTLPLWVCVDPGAMAVKGVPHIPQSSKAVVSPPDSLISYPGHFVGKVLPLCRDADGVFYNPIRFGWIHAFVMGISAKMKQKQLDPDLNLIRQAHFLRR